MSGTFPIGPSFTPDWAPGYVPSAVEWSSMWSNKLDTDDAKLTGAPWLPEAGGTMTGALVLDHTPTTLDGPLTAATKAYVDAITPVSGPFLPMSGGTMTGLLTLALDPSGMFDAVTKRYADNIGTNASNALTIAQNALSRTGGTMTGPLTLSGDPGTPLGAATKQYVDRFLPLSGGTINGGVVVNSNLQANGLYASSVFSPNSFNNWEWQLLANSNGDKIQQYRANWYDVWSGTNGARSWNGPSGSLMSLAASGQLTVSGNISVGSAGVNYSPFGGHNFAFGWNGNLNLYIDNGYQFDVASTNWVSGAFLPLGGGHITGILGVDGAVLFNSTLTVNGLLATATSIDTGGNGSIYTSFHGSNAFAFAQQGASIYGYMNGGAVGSLVPPSAQELKRDIQPATLDCLGTVRHINLHQFRYKDDDTLKPTGFLAEELHELLPGSVGLDADGKPFIIDPMVVLALLTGAVQQLAALFNTKIGAAKEA